MRADDGTAVIEFALVVPLLVILILGVFEAGMAFRNRNQFESALRLAIRTDSNLGAKRSADFNGLSSLQVALGGLKNVKINYVIIYRGDPSFVINTATASAVPAACVNLAESAAVKDNPTPGSYGGTGSPSGTGYGVPSTGTPGVAPADACNIYTRGMLTSAPNITNFGGSGTPPPTTCASTDWDRFWCPVASPGRVTDMKGNSGKGTDVIGMYVSYTYTTYTKLFVANTLTMTDNVLARVEPAVS
jgi:hypothetical protein